jgi:hypothetical protein
MPASGWFDFQWSNARQYSSLNRIWRSSISPTSRDTDVVLFRRLTPSPMLADPEHCLTSAVAADPLPENRFPMNRHARHRWGLDNGN